MALLKPETRRRLQETDERWQKKLILRIIASVFAFLGTVMFAAAIPKWNETFRRVDSINSTDWTDGIVLGPLVFSLIYNTISITYTVTHTRPFPILATLILDLLVFLAYVCAIIIAILGGIFWYWAYGNAIADDDGTLDCRIWYNRWSRDCSPIFYVIGGLEVAGIVFAFIAMCLTFTTFISACKDHSRRRQNRRMLRRQGTELGIPALRQPVPPPAYEERVTTDPYRSAKFV